MTRAPLPPAPFADSWHKGGFPKGWFWRMFSRNENRNEGAFGCSPGTRKPERGYVRMFPQNENRNEGPFTKTGRSTEHANREIWPHECAHEWAHESAHESAHEGAHESAHGRSFPCLSPSRTPHERPHETSHEGVHGSAHESVHGSGQFSHVLFSHVLFVAQKPPFYETALLRNRPFVSQWRFNGKRSEGPKGGRRKGGRGRKLSHFSFCCAFRFPVWGEELWQFMTRAPLPPAPFADSWKEQKVCANLLCKLFLFGRAGFWGGSPSLDNRCWANGFVCQ